MIPACCTSQHPRFVAADRGTKLRMLLATLLRVSLRSSGGDSAVYGVTNNSELMHALYGDNVRPNMPIQQHLLPHQRTPFLSSFDGYGTELIRVHLRRAMAVQVQCQCATDWVDACKWMDCPSLGRPIWSRRESPVGSAYCPSAANVRSKAALRYTTLTVHVNTARTGPRF